MLNADRAVPPPPPPPAAPAPDSDDDDASFTEADYERPPDEPKPKKKTSSALPPGWVAKWSERKQMYILPRGRYPVDSPDVSSARAECSFRLA